MPDTKVKLNDLMHVLVEKRNIYDHMIGANKEFDEVKEIFLEIRHLEEAIRHMTSREDMQ